MKTNIFKLMNKYSINQDEVIDIADRILKNQLIIKFKYLPEKLNEDIKELRYDDKFDWNIEYGSYTNMAMLHLHAWEPLNYLILAYHYSSQKHYLDKCLDLIRSWYKASLNNNHKYLYYPHCVSDRTLILSYLLTCDLKDTDHKLLNSITKIHKKFLLNDMNYVKFNHGTMMDRSLSTLLIVQEDFEVLEKIIERLRQNIDNTFTKNMICVENSFTYSIFNLELIVSIQKEMFDFHHIKIIDDFDYNINKALDFLNIVKKPDNSLPMYGDGELITLINLKKSILYDYYPDHELFSQYNQQSEISRGYYFKNEGYLIIKSDKFHFFIRAGDFIKNHKHGDDLSFTLYNDGEIFSDPGTYNYDIGEIRDYLKSSASHNSLTLNNEDYSHAKSTLNDHYIHTFEEYDDHFHIKVKHSSYTFADISRNFYILKRDHTLIIIDNISTPLKLNNKQNYNLSKEFINNFSINKIGQKLILNNKLLIHSLNVDNIYTTFNPNNYYSEKFQNLRYIPKIEMIKYGENQTMFTVISNNIDNTIAEDVTFNSDNTFSFSYMNYEYNLFYNNEKNEINIKNYLFIQNDGCIYSFETFASFYEKQEYAWYIYKDEIRYDIIWYQNSSLFNYTLNEAGNYKIRCFIRNQEDKAHKREFTAEKIIKIPFY